MVKRQNPRMFNLMLKFGSNEIGKQKKAVFFQAFSCSFVCSVLCFYKLRVIFLNYLGIVTKCNVSVSLLLCDQFKWGSTETMKSNSELVSTC